MINWPIILNPVNWVIVTMFLVLWVVTITLAHQQLSGE